MMDRQRQLLALMSGRPEMQPIGAVLLRGEEIEPEDEVIESSRIRILKRDVFEAPLMLHQLVLKQVATRQLFLGRIATDRARCGGSLPRSPGHRNLTENARTSRAGALP